nr:calmodulin-binding receptor-like cytoplasmic kinase 2 [Coffea arabica]
MKTPSPLIIRRCQIRKESPSPCSRTSAISNQTSATSQKSRSSSSFIRAASKRVAGVLAALLFWKREVNSTADQTKANKIKRAVTGLSDSIDDSTGSTSKSSSRTKYSYSRESSNDNIIQIGSLQTSFNEISKATGNFSSANIIGEGAFGTVYKGKLWDGFMVAIKRAKMEFFDQRLSAEFKNEILTLSKIEHLNLVRFLGYLEHGIERIIIVEYVSNGTLREHLDGTRGDGLETAERLDIATDVAHAITYLHTYTEPPIIHRDIKASNILLTEKYRAKVADFGFARLAAEDPTATHISTQVKGTAGYLDPEYLKTYQLTEKSDVYSFGVLLVEMITGRHPIDSNKSTDERVTVRWALRKLKDGEVAVVMDPRLRRNPASNQAVEKVLKLARQCLDPSRRARPSMKRCAEVLWQIRKEFKDSSIVHTAAAAAATHHSANVVEGGIRRDWQDLYGIPDTDYYRFYSSKEKKSRTTHDCLEI